MDKSMTIFCEQNPKISFPCGNSHCKKKHTFKSKDVFKHKSFEFKCDVCEYITKVDTSEFVKKFESELKKLGVHLK